MQPLSVIILAGGESRRMGTNKALLQLPSGDTLISRVVDNLQALTDDMLVVSHDPALYGALPASQVTDRFSNAGPLAGLHAGLEAARHTWSFVVACDMPLVDSRLVRFMTVLSEGYDVVIPEQDGELEPLHALYSKACIDPIARRLEAGERRVISFLPDVQTRRVSPREMALLDPEGRSFFNANTPEDWQRLQKLLSGKSSRRSGQRRS